MKYKLKLMMKIGMRKDRAGPEARGEVLLPDSDGFVAAARSEDEWDTGVTGGQVSIQAPNPIGVAFESLNLFQLHHRQSILLFCVH